MGRPFLWISSLLWPVLRPFSTTRPVAAYGALIQRLVRLREPRNQYHGTYFMRNRPELKLISDIANRSPHGCSLKICVMACSNGAEVYSILWTIRSARPDLKLVVHAIDISDDVLQMAKEGMYSLKVHERINSQVFERLTHDERQAMFDKEGHQFRIKSWLKEGINWLVGDAGDPEMVNRLGPQDIVVANKFLCHMDPADAEKCLRNLAGLVAPGGYLFVSGVDLDVRTRVAMGLGWTPITDLIEDIHNGDDSVRHDWPWKYWGLEPFDSKRPDYLTRYAAAFQVNRQTKICHANCAQ